MRGLAKAALLFCTIAWSGDTLADPPGKSKTATVERICDLIDTHAGRFGVPRDFFARLIWKESRFDANAVSPVGAEGIAQFMPGTAKIRGLADPFDIEQAIEASARYLGELKTGFGNLGLAAAAYNAGESRVSRWLSSGGFLPLETENYVLDIMGEPAENFTNASYAGTVHPLDKEKDFAEACRRLPIVRAATTPMARINIKPWGVQVAGNVRRDAAIRQWQRERARFPSLLRGYDPVVSRVRSPIGRQGIYAVRIGADSRAAADVICQKLRGAGGACVVMRNR
ncbi:lytic transglycosylase domain-containing protein [Aquamicrobium sp. LC103]|uniref:lytic transglycosylase domain-containing protein n=1 Tax=Aquamicrobium sp. LC103 TaxID=1120658 RepID=UPI00063ED18E|nr:lytic transglycosylase domain-containing protein [Aquamicrobium sp. LC103]TKT75458.1 lytic transglycosylase domain-containing protein [Aquamicrobium sp. LC103]